MLALKCPHWGELTILFSEKSRDFFEVSSFSDRVSAPNDRTDVSLPSSILEYAKRIFSVVASSGKIKSISIGYSILRDAKM